MKDGQCVKSGVLSTMCGLLWFPPLPRSDPFAMRGPHCQFSSQKSNSPHFVFRVFIFAFGPKGFELSPFSKCGVILRQGFLDKQPGLWLGRFRPPPISPALSSAVFVTAL